MTLCPSPHWGSRRSPISAVVIHHTGKPTDPLEGVVEWFQNPMSRVSAHYVVGRDGGIAQCVPEERVAWHAGRSSMEGEPDVNRFAVGIELCGDGNLAPYPQAQIDALVGLLRGIRDRWGVRVERIVGHQDICVPPGRKVDPGKLFPWEEVREALR